MGYLCHNLARRGWLRSYLLVLDGAPAVTQFGFAYGRKYYAYKAAFSPTFAASSPGTALSAFTLRNEIEQGTTEFDYLVGEYDYKQYWGNDVRGIDYLMVFSERVVSRVKTGVLLLLMQLVRVTRGIATRVRRTARHAPRPQHPVE
jgi:CelD/BcsL family acetyltransferase involved in cellulose biosynthesis